MMPDIATTPAERTEAAQRLIDEAQAAPYVELVTVSALELCVLGGPKQALADEAVTRAWLELKDRRREKMMKQVTDGMVERGLLLPEPGAEPGRAAYTRSETMYVGLNTNLPCHQSMFYFILYQLWYVMCLIFFFLNSVIL